MSLDKIIDPNDHLLELGSSNFEIVDGEPDIRGWAVKNTNGQKIGEVADLLFSPQSLNVRYIVVELDEEDRKVLVPIGTTELHPNDDDVILPGVTPQQLTALPLYEKDNLSPEIENTIRSIFENTSSPETIVPSYSRNAFYDHDHFNEEKFYNGRKSSEEENTKLPVIVNSTSNKEDLASVDESGLTNIQENPLIQATHTDHHEGNVSVIDQSETPAIQNSNDASLFGNNNERPAIEEIVIIEEKRESNQDNNNNSSKTKSISDSTNLDLDKDISF